VQNYNCNTLCVYTTFPYDFPIQTPLLQEEQTFPKPKNPSGKQYSPDGGKSNKIVNALEKKARVVDRNQ